jgi:tRNA (adenine37-N6)-methyltransferase
MPKIEFEPIGIFKSCYLDKFGTPRQAGLVKESEGLLIIHPKFQPELSLIGLEGFSHLWVLFYFHANGDHKFHAKIHPPRLEGKTMGLFSTRSPHRPNPIGLSLLKIKGISDAGIQVSGIDLIDKTPVLDIKPYLPSLEALPDAKEGWLSELNSRSLTVTWETEKPQDLQLLDLIENTIKQDPRPQIYRESRADGQAYRDSHAIRIHHFDVHFRILPNDEASIFKINSI